jgi:class 3 adenylate cyclase
MTSTRAALKELSAVDLAKEGRALARTRPSLPEELDGICDVAEVLLEKDEPLLAFEVLNLVRSAFPNDTRLRQGLGLALARSGATEEAQKILDLLWKEQKTRKPTNAKEKIAFEETLCMLGRTYKDLGLALEPGGALRDHDALQHALQLYSAAYFLRLNYYPAINVAFLNQVLDNHEAAAQFAERVRKQCREIVDGPSRGATHEPRYWHHASLGEAELILGARKAATQAYGEAGTICRAKGLYGNLGSIHRQLRYLLAALGEDPRESARYLKMPRVAVFTGHMVDRTDRPSARFPERLAARVKKRIAAWLKKEDIGIGYSSAACGSDLLFIEALLEKGGEAHVILPFGARDFRGSSVDITTTKKWTTIFDHVIEKVSLDEVSERPLNFGEVAYTYANQLLHGAAIRRADRLGADLKRLAVWDGGPGDGPEGTADVVGSWLQLTREIDIIGVPGVTPATPFAVSGLVAPLPWRSQTRTAPRTIGTQVAALLFADVCGFSKMSEDQIPRFVDEFLGAIANLLDKRYRGTEKRNTWGDGLYIAFDKIEAAGLFALELTGLVSNTDWSKHGLPPGLGLRTALHAGPVYICTDPVTMRYNCIGTNVSHAARLEPSTPENQVYASVQFAALSAALGIKSFACRYVGHVDWAKGYGVFPTYHVVRQSTVESL